MQSPNSNSPDFDPRIMKNPMLPSEIPATNVHRWMAAWWHLQVEVLPAPSCCPANPSAAPVDRDFGDLMRSGDLNIMVTYLKDQLGWSMAYGDVDLLFLQFLFLDRFPSRRLNLGYTVLAVAEWLCLLTATARK